MTDKERMEERIYIFADADKRKSLTAEELAACPTVGEALETMAE